MSKFSPLLAKHLQQVYFGGNWCGVNVKGLIDKITWEELLQSNSASNSVLSLVYHMHYYVQALHCVLLKRGLNSKDALSFKVDHICDFSSWLQYKSKLFEEANAVAELLLNLQDEQLFAVFEHEQYGNYFDNIFGIIEHLHYHLGQLKLMLSKKA